MRHIYVQTLDGLGKLNFYDKLVWNCNYVVEHYKHKPKFCSGIYKGKYLSNAYHYSKEDIKFLKKRPLIDLITKRKE